MRNKERRGHKNKFNLKRTVMVTAGAVAIFMFGLGIGNGRINIGPDAVFRRSVSKNLPAELDYSGVDEVYRNLKTTYDGQLDKDKLYDGLREGLAKAAGDPYTEFFNPKAAKDFDDDLNGTFTGIGAELSKDAQNNIVIISPIGGFPAEKSGLKPRDIIAEIDGKSAYDLTVSEAVSKIRGPKDTKVKLKIVRSGNVQDYEITRAQITIPSVESKILDNNIGYIKISRFGDDTTALVSKYAQEMKDKQVKGVVLDLRSDPGGLLDAAVEVSSQWLPSGKKVLDEKRGGVVVRTYNADGKPTLSGVPTVVLIDEGSASASEITAGALKDNGVARLIGQKSFGKGSVQQLIKLKDGSVVKITAARWYTPSGKNIDKEGITPDQKVERTEDDFKNGRDPQLDAAVVYLNK